MLYFYLQGKLLLVNNSLSFDIFLDGEYDDVWWYFKSNKPGTDDDDDKDVIVTEKLWRFCGKLIYMQIQNKKFYLHVNVNEW